MSNSLHGAERRLTKKIRRGPQSAAAVKASDCAADAEKELSCILTDVLDYNHLSL